MVDSHFENFPHKHLNCLLLEEVVGTCQDSQSCQEDLHCHHSECAGTGFHFLLEGFFFNQARNSATWEKILFQINEIKYKKGVNRITYSNGISCRYILSVADLGGVRGVQMDPPLAASNVFCVHNCTSPSNDYAAVACSNNNQAQLHTHVSVPYRSPDVWLGLELLRDIQFGPRGPPQRASVNEISKSTGFHVDFGFHSGFLDFSLDFCISVWISADRFLLVCSWI